MTEPDLIDLATRILRRTRDPEVVTLCSEVMARIAKLALPAKPAFNKRAYMRDYMRTYRNKAKEPNPFM